MTQSNHLKLVPLYGTSGNIIFGDIVLYFSAPMTVQTSGYQSKISCPKTYSPRQLRISHPFMPLKRKIKLLIKERIYLLACPISSLDS